MWATKQNNQQNKKEVEALHLLKHTLVRMMPVSVPLAKIKVFYQNWNVKVHVSLMEIEVLIIKKVNQ